MRWRFRKSLVNAFEPSRRAAACEGPKQARPAAVNRSTMPATSGPSGPTMVSAAAWRTANSSKPSMSSAGMSTLQTLGSSAVPAFPGATNTCETRGECAHFQASACSRPPPPTMRIFMRILVAKVTHSGEHHRDAVLVGRGNDLRVAFRSARLYHRRDPELRERVEPVAKREEGVGGNACRIEIEAGILGLEGGDFTADYATHLPGSDAHSRLVLHADDGIGFDIFCNPPREDQIIQFGEGRHALRHRTQFLRAYHAVISCLHEQTAGDAFVFQQLHHRIGRITHLEHAHGILGREQRFRRFRHPWRKNHFDE